MYDPATAALIQSTPELDDLDTKALPDRLTQAFAEIVSARVMLREGDVDLASLSETTKFARRLAQTNEALVAIDPAREKTGCRKFCCRKCLPIVISGTDAQGTRATCIVYNI